MSKDTNNHNNNNNKQYNQSIEDLIESEEGNGLDTTPDSYEYEDEYVYGDTDKVDYTKLGYKGSDGEGDEEDDYSNPKQGSTVKGKYDYLLVDDEDKETSDPDEKLPLDERVSVMVNKALDFVESKKFTTVQWVLALGVLITLGVIIVVLLQAGGNLGSNVDYQEQEGAKYVAKEVAPEEYKEQESHTEVKNTQKEELEDYVDRKSEEYEKQTSELGEIPEGYTAVQDIDGTVKYLSPEEYEELINNDVRTGTPASGKDTVNASEEVESMEIEIMPAKEDVWYEITATPLKEIDEEAIYQSRGQFIYFVQKALKVMYAQQLLGAEFDTDTYTMTAILNPNATYKLPEDFEERMQLAYKNSGYQTQAPDKLTIEYKDGDINDYINQ